jgi:hypothetical protein
VWRDPGSIPRVRSMVSGIPSSPQFTTLKALVLSGRNDDLIRRQSWMPDTGFWIGEALRLGTV